MLRRVLFRPYTLRYFSLDYSHRQYARHPSLVSLGIRNPNVFRNMSPPELYEQAINPRNNWTNDPTGRPTMISSTGALCTYSGERTDRVPSEKRIVLDEITKQTVNWSRINIPLDPKSYKANWSRAVDYLNALRTLYMIDGYLGWDSKSRMKVRVICSLPYHALFMRNMLIVPKEAELAEFDRGADFTILDAGDFKADPTVPGVTQKTSVAINFTDNTMCVLGTNYAGEIKKGLFTMMNYWMPLKGSLSMHSSANEGINEDVTLFIGPTGSGKTTLSADLRRKLIGDDELVWAENGVFNIEGGCYAKCSHLTRRKEPQIYDAIKFGTVLENVNFHDTKERIVDYDDVSITENTRASYPLEYIMGAKIPAVCAHPKNIILLTNDAYGVFPPVSKLTPEQAMYHFVSGFTTKVAMTQLKVEQPRPVFTACFGESYLPLHPSVYAKVLKDKIIEHNCDVWLINTGWTGGPFPNGERIPLKITRAIIDAINFGELVKSEYTKMEVFGFGVPRTCIGVEPEILDPKSKWKSETLYTETLYNLAGEFKKNFEKYANRIDKEVIEAGPKV